MPLASSKPFVDTNSEAPYKLHFFEIAIKGQNTKGETRKRCLANWSLSGAELGEHQLTIRDYLRHSNLSVTNKYLQAVSTSKRNAQAKLIEAILPLQLLSGKTDRTVAP